MLTDLENRKLRTDIRTAWIGTIALVLGGGFAVVQYLDKDKGDRVKESLAFLDRYNKSPFMEARRNIAITWEKYEKPQKAILEKKPFVPQDFSRFVLSTIQADKRGQDIALIIEYFESLEVCVRKKICDSDTAVQFFKLEARAFYRQHYSHIEAVRKVRNEPDYALDLYSFTKREP